MKKLIAIIIFILICYLCSLCNEKRFNKLDNVYPYEVNIYQYK